MDHEYMKVSQNVSLNPTEESKKPQSPSPITKRKNIQKIVQESIHLLGGAACILLQVAMPGVGKGVNKHSNFAERPLDRLRTTMTYIYCIAFGTVEERKMIIEKVHRVHAMVKGEGYAADDPELQVWVAATVYAVAIKLYEQAFGKLDDESAEEVYQEYAILAVSLRARPDMWPRDRQAFKIYWDDQIKRLQHQIDSHAKNVAHDLLYNKNMPFGMGYALPVLRLVTADLLPEGIRDAYGLKPSRGERILQWVIMWLIMSIYPLLPLFIRTFPMRYYLNDMRGRMKCI